LGGSRGRESGAVGGDATNALNCVEIDLRADGANVGIVEIRESAADARIEDGAAANGEGGILVYTEAGLEESGLERLVELELVVDDNLALAIVLIVKDAALQGNNGSLGALCYTLQDY